MTVMRAERVVHGVTDLAECERFLGDFGLERVPGEGSKFATQTRQIVKLRAADDPQLPLAVEEGSTLREIVWGFDTQEALNDLAAQPRADVENGEAHTADETGFGIGLAVRAPEPWHGEVQELNRTGTANRWNQPVRHPGRVRPIRLCQVALNIPKEGRDRAVAFYTERLGFVPTDRVRDVGVFMRDRGDTDHHTLLLGHRADRACVNHTAYEVAAVNEVIVGANEMIDRGWHEARRLGRHTIGSNFCEWADGQRNQAERGDDILDPATGQVLGRVPFAGLGDVGLIPLQRAPTTCSASRGGTELPS